MSTKAEFNKESTKVRLEADLKELALKRSNISGKIVLKINDAIRYLEIEKATGRVKED